MDEGRASIAAATAEDTAGLTGNASGDGGTKQDDERAAIADSGENDAISASGIADGAGESGPAAIADGHGDGVKNADGLAAGTGDSEPAAIADGEEDEAIRASGLAAETEGTDGAANKTGLGEDASGNGEIVRVDSPGCHDKTAKLTANPEEQLDGDGNKITKHFKDASANASDGGEKAASASTNDGCEEAERAGGSGPDRGGGDHATIEVAGQAGESPAIAIDHNQSVGVMVDDEGGAKVAEAKGKKQGELVDNFVAIALRHHV